MKKNFNIRNILIILLICIFSLNKNTKASQDIKIVMKINNSIITNTDISRELNYLMALNSDLSKIKKEEVLEIAKDSLIREKIKTNEIVKYLDFENFQNDEIINPIIKNIYTRIGFEEASEFNDYLKTFDISFEEVKKKIKIEVIWNQLIAEKFKKQIVIDEEKIRKKIENEKMNYKDIVEYDLSEIVFNASNDEEFNSKRREIEKIIETISFETAANKFSISDTANFGGNIGKVNESQLSEIIKSELNNLDINGYTTPINIGNNFIIIKINEKKIKNLKLDEDELLKKLIGLEQKKQYENFSLIYFNKIKLNSQINEL